MLKNDSKIWDVAVIGGGPAGMIAAGKAAENGASVILLEKNKALGKKLLLTGGGRCNLTNAEMDTRKFLEKYDKDGKFLFSAFAQFGVKETLDFFNSQGLKTKIEPGLRVFPISDQAQSVLNVLTDFMKKGNVTVMFDSHVARFKKHEEKLESVILKNGKEIKAKSFIVATGGKSHPETGSTGDAFDWLKDIGHKITEPEAALVPVAIKDTWVKELQGLVISEVKISVMQNGKKQISKKGRILFTHFGLSGPTILNMSKDIGELLKYDGVNISLDLLPSHGHDKVNLLLQELFAKYNKKQLKNCLDEIIPARIVPFVMKFSGIEPETLTNGVTREQRLNLIKHLKEMNMKVQGLLGVEEAIITSGGVDLTEVDFKTMSSRLFSNLYLIGDILDINRPSGGFSLQLCWTTGYIAGKSASSNS